MPSSSPRRHVLTLLSVAALAAQWIVFRALHFNLSAPWEAVLPGIAILAAGFLLSWAAELAQMDIPQALALAFVALIAVLPEYAVDIYFAWKAGKDPAYLAYATANMTGGNRLLIGAGWATIVFVTWLRYGRKSISLEPGHRLELFALVAATLYSLAIPFKQTLSLIDSVVLLLLFFVYMRAASRAHMVEPELEGGVAEWLSRLSAVARRSMTLGISLLSCLAIFLAASPFAEGLLKLGRHFQFEEFILVQWIAPLASEAPEFIVAILFAMKNKPGAGLGTLVASKVNQWTLLVGMLPIAYALSHGSLLAMHMDPRQVEEFLLTSAQSLFAIAVLCDLEFSIWDGLAIFLLFCTQLFFIDSTIRMIYAVVYLLLTFALLIFKRSVWRGFQETLRYGLTSFR